MLTPMLPRHTPLSTWYLPAIPDRQKTTVARLIAEILAENQVLYRGKLHEVGRSDLVGKYVGWTAKLVKEAFEKAKGSVLFIDEAYSLVDKQGSFGDEAINAIVQEMENSRGSTVVIFAGYPDKMEHFLDRNPGLRSRIAFHVPFEDYTPEELVEITACWQPRSGCLWPPAQRKNSCPSTARPSARRTSAMDDLPEICWKEPVSVRPAVLYVPALRRSDNGPGSSSRRISQIRSICESRSGES